MIQRILNLRPKGYVETIQEAVLAAQEGSPGAIEALTSWGITLVDDGLHLQMEINPYIGDPAEVATMAKARLRKAK
jgi:hypothetical protein